MATYEEFLKAYNDAGFNASNFSAEDMTLAKLNPDAGLGIIQAKRDWQNATTPEMRALANQNAESIRKMYGNYLGGQNGMQSNVQPTAAMQGIMSGAGFNQGQYSNSDIIMGNYDNQLGQALTATKLNWQNAGDEAGRQQANADAEMLRSYYGGYTGGANGLGYQNVNGLYALPAPQQAQESYTPNPYRGIPQGNPLGTYPTGGRPQAEESGETQSAWPLGDMLPKPQEKPAKNPTQETPPAQQTPPAQENTPPKEPLEEDTTQRFPQGLENDKDIQDAMSNGGLVTWDVWQKLRAQYGADALVRFGIRVPYRP